MLGGPATVSAAAGEKENERLQACATIFEEIMGASDKGIPGDLLEKSAALVFIPGVKKGAFIFGGEFGRGIMVVRNENGKGWGAPGFIKMTGGSFGFQIGGQNVDVILVVRNRKGIEKLVNNKFKLGADASVAGGPVGRTAKADTDAQMQAQILCYSRTQGVFAGISLEGASIQMDGDSNKKTYGRTLSGKEVLAGDVVKRPEASAKLYDLIKKYAG
ncbi:MAG: lipid-binding SYLF domain-containing protein [Blastocatellia bacterium]|nr:lipid-binding SYLF domain-containing protein [Blastocatellia bacterium]